VEIGKCGNVEMKIKRCKIKISKAIKKK